MVKFKVLGMKQIIKLIGIIGLLLFLYGCKDDELTLQRVPYYGNELRIDGYYYHEYGEPARKNIYFLYRNGIILYGTTPLTSEIEQTENMYQTGKYYELVKNDKTSWGVFLINGNTLKFEKWYSGEEAWAYISEGEILNDTTFHITVSYRSNTTERREGNEIYHFRQFNSKPDSTNNFIK